MRSEQCWCTIIRRAPQALTRDIETTKEIGRAAEALGIAIHDHLVVGRKGHASFRSRVGPFGPHFHWSAERRVRFEKGRRFPLLRRRAADRRRKRSVLRCRAGNRARQRPRSRWRPRPAPAAGQAPHADARANAYEHGRQQPEQQKPPRALVAVVKALGAERKADPDGADAACAENDIGRRVAKGAERQQLDDRDDHQPESENGCDPDPVFGAVDASPNLKSRFCRSMNCSVCYRPASMTPE